MIYQIDVDDIRLEVKANDSEHLTEVVAKILPGRAVVVRNATTNGRPIFIMPMKA
jgi:hypothetical protein